MPVRISIFWSSKKKYPTAPMKPPIYHRCAFLDASHLYNDVKQEFDTVLPKLTEDALVIFDNTYRIADEGEDPRVNGFLCDMPALYDGNLINMEFGGIRQGWRFGRNGGVVMNNRGLSPIYSQGGDGWFL